ncbi:MAG TPA: cytochrome P450 [Bryobacteraceae bacterium]|nr:cytochrome P450 [Bryobacteraceae bacterium]
MSPRSTAGEEHREFREAAFAAVRLTQLANWKPQRIQPVDLVSDVAKPWSLEIATIVTDIPLSEAKRLLPLATDIFNAAAEPFDTQLQDNAKHATLNLAQKFSSPAFQVQAFVALSQTLPCFLANAWHALLRRPDQIDKLHYPTAIDELLRYAGPSRAILRYAQEDVRIGDVEIPKGATVALVLAEANRDHEQFSEPDRLDLTRQPPRHLAFGLGNHSCVGAWLVRAASIHATQAIISVLADATIVECTLDERFGIQSLKSLRIR